MLPSLDNYIVDFNVNLEDDIYYFLNVTGLNNFIDFTNDLIPVLEKKYGQKVKPVNISYDYIDSDNYIICNANLKKMISNGSATKYDKVLPSENLGLSISESPVILDLISKLSDKQDHLFVNVFKNSSQYDLSGLDSKIVMLGPKPGLAEHFDNKIIQWNEVAKNLGLRIPKTFKLNSVNDLIKCYKSNFTGDAFLRCPYSEAGNGVKILHSIEDILVSDKLYHFNDFLLSELIDVDVTPAVFGIIASGEVYIVEFHDQILKDGTSFTGATYPSKISLSQKNEIIETTRKIGQYLQETGYRGPFGVDYMISKYGMIYFSEINPRYPGGIADANYVHGTANPALLSLMEIVFTSTVEGFPASDNLSGIIPDVPFMNRLLIAKKGFVVPGIEPVTDEEIVIYGYPEPGTKFFYDGYQGWIIVRLSDSPNCFA